MKTKKTLTDIMKNQTITNQFDFTGSCPDKDGVSHTYNIFTTGFFLNEINHNYFDRVMFVDPDAAFTDLVSTFSVWAQNRGYMYARLAYGYSLGYNPIENYSSIEKHTGHDDFDNKKKVTHTWTQDTITHTYDGNNPLKVTREYDANNPLKVETGHDNDKDETTYNQFKDTDKAWKFGVNSASKVQQTENETERNGTETVEHKGKKSDTTTGKYFDTTTGTYTDTHTGSYSDENSGKDSTIYDSTLTKSGNIGIQTPADMLMREYEGLKMNLARRALWDFLDNFTFYSEGVGWL